MSAKDEIVSKYFIRIIQTENKKEEFDKILSEVRTKFSPELGDKILQDLRVKIQDIAGERYSNFGGEELNESLRYVQNFSDVQKSQRSDDFFDLLNYINTKNK